MRYCIAVGTRGKTAAAGRAVPAACIPIEETGESAGAAGVEVAACISIDARDQIFQGGRGAFQFMRQMTQYW